MDNQDPFDKLQTNYLQLARTVFKTVFLFTIGVVKQETCNTSFS
jgi:hypothetical protein